MNFIIQSLHEAWLVLLESAPFVLLGFCVAGFIKAFVPDDLAKRHLGGTGAWPVFKAALLGVPLPLCSCGVVPAAAGLRQAGAGKGATTAFLISTPETGVDSILVNYALLDPLMTVLRPVAAFFTGVFGGLLVNRFAPDPPAYQNTPAPSDDPAPRKAPSTDDAPPSPPAPDTPSAPPFPLGPPASAPQSAAQASAGCCAGCSCAAPVPTTNLRQRLRAGMAYAFGDMLPDIGGWLLLGVLVAGVIGAAMPQDGMRNFPGGELGSMLAMLVLGLPLYVCATASTPIAAALALHGLSPGAVLVFMLSGPATNAASVTVVWRMFGTRATAIYLASIAGCSLLFGVVANLLYQAMGLDLSSWLSASPEDAPGLMSWLSALVLLGLTARPHVRPLLHRPENPRRPLPGMDSKSNVR